jgi:Xanthine and CO dehydrogenases maturation factor, XdhC/CoxF family
MNVWSTLGDWAEKRDKAFTITLLSAPGPEAGLAGAMAVLPDQDAPPQGPLTEAPFWAADWEAGLKTALEERIGDIGTLLTIEGRRYAMFPLSYCRSALVMGGGHVGGALCRLLRFLDFEVTLMDDREEFLRDREDGRLTVRGNYDQLGQLFPEPGFDAVAIVTRGHAHDSECLRKALSWTRMPPYLGMIGSRSRTRKTLEMLTGEGFDPERLARIRTPIGLSIGAQTPAEIAVSIAAEIIQDLNQAES